MISEVLSNVHPDDIFFYHIVYEWDDEVAKYLGVPVRKNFVGNKLITPDNSIIKQKIGRLRHVLAEKVFLTFPYLRRVLWDDSRPAYPQDINLPLSVCFIMHIAEISLISGNNCIPVFLDVWSDFNIEEIARRTKDFKLFYVSYLEVYKRMKARYPWSNVRYIPQSVADKYHSENFAAYRNKTIDVVHIGRRNPVLHEYMLRYCSEHQDIEYVFRDGENCVSATSRKTWPIATRSDYMNLLAASKVSLAGCSGVDNARANTYGICTMTPRFYESAISGCAILSRYPDNEEFRMLNAKRYFPNITSYEQFTRELERALSQTPEELYAQNRDFILSSLTSRRAEQIRHDLEEISCGQNS